MTETLNIQVQPQAIETQPIPTTREEKLHDLMPYDYEFAEEKGLIDMFVYDPDTGEDGLIHTLAGDVRTGANDEQMVEGFHHEPSGGIVEPYSTVDREHLEGLNSKKRVAFKEFPLEPYNAKVAIHGLRKHVIREDPVTGEVTKGEAKNSMYPKDYDPLAVLQSIRIAKESRDVSQDQDSMDDRGRHVKVAIGQAPLMDGQSSMNIRLVMDTNPDPQQRKIYTAIPIVPQRPGVMRLDQQGADNLIYGNL
ncbi:MAG: hypothetical protein ABWX94_00720 [Candidatus Saccharimonadales bacterium]